MILYFSGTGNSRFAAEAIRSVTGDSLVSLNDRIRQGNTEPLHSETPFVFVCPTYAWRIPRVVEQHIRNTQLSGSKKAYFILTCGDSAGDAAPYAKRLCARNELNFLGRAEVVMPENYIAIYEAPSPEKEAEIIKKALPELTRIAEIIKQQKPLSPPTPTARDWIKSAVINPWFYTFIVSAKGFYATDACTNCGRCASLCPLSNIHLAEGKPVWGKDCTHCMACICACPTEAIQYKNNTQSKRRYYLTKSPKDV